MADFYKILGVNKNASQEEIKRAFKKAAIKYHPDRNPGDKEAEKKFKEINEANEVLSDQEKREKYDRFGDDWDKINTGGMDGFDMSDFFNNMRNPFADMFNSRREREAEQGQSIKYQIPLDINDIFNGGSREIEITIDVRCPDCQGDGGEVKTCPYCHGTGMVTKTIQLGPGQIMQTSQPCNHCHGTGKEFIKKCKKCNGSGFIRKTEKIKVSWNPGVQNYHEDKYTGKGYESKDKNGPNGNLFIQYVYQIDENKYAIQGNIIYEKITIPYYDCIIGTTLERKLPNDKKININIPEYTKEGDQIKIYGEGINRGVYIFIVSIEMPTYISDNEKTLLKEIQKLH